MKDILLNVKRVFGRFMGLLYLFSVLLSVFFLVIMPFELYKAVASQKWEQRKLLIKSNELLYHRVPYHHRQRGLGSSHSLKIIASDADTGNVIEISDVMYGDFPFTFNIFSKAIFSSYYKYMKKYPEGATVIGYKDPQSNKYVLEKGKITFPIIAMCISVMWISVNTVLTIRNIRNRQK